MVPTGPTSRTVLKTPTAPTAPGPGPGKRLSHALGDAVSDLYAKGSDSSKAAAIWGEAVGPVGLRHTRGIYVKQPEAEGGAPTLYVYLDGNAFVYEYSTDRILYEQRLAYLGFPVERLVFRLSRSAGAPAPSTERNPSRSPSRGPAGSMGAAAPSLAAGEPKARPLEELRPLDGGRERWARSSVEGLPDDLGDAVYRAMTSSMRRNQDEGR